MSSFFCGGLCSQKGKVPQTFSREGFDGLFIITQEEHACEHSSLCIILPTTLWQPAALRLAACGRSWLHLQPRAWYRAAPRALPLISKNSQQACAFCPMPGDAPRKPPLGREQILLPALKDLASVCFRAVIVFLCPQTWGLDRR